MSSLRAKPIAKAIARVIAQRRVLDMRTPHNARRHVQCTVHRVAMQHARKLMDWRHVLNNAKPAVKALVLEKPTANANLSARARAFPDAPQSFRMPAKPD